MLTSTGSFCGEMAYTLEVTPIIQLLELHPIHKLRPCSKTYRWKSRETLQKMSLPPPFPPFQKMCLPPPFPPFQTHKQQSLANVLSHKHKMHFLLSNFSHPASCQILFQASHLKRGRGFEGLFLRIN